MIFLRLLNGEVVNSGKRAQRCSSVLVPQRRGLGQVQAAAMARDGLSDALSVDVAPRYVFEDPARPQKPATGTLGAGGRHP